MHILASSLHNMPVISLRNGQVVSSVDCPVIKPENLEIVAMFCNTSVWRKRNSVVMTRDIREIAKEGLVIDSLEDIEDPSEIVRLKSILEQQYQPIGAEVITQTGTKLGKVEDYAIDTLSFKIQKFYLKQSLLKNLLLNNLVIDRSQIIDVTPKTIIVRDASVAKPLKKAARVLAPTPVIPTPE